MEQFETRFSQVDVLPMVKHFMDELDMFNLFKRYVPAAPDCLANHAESLCVLTANIICDNLPQIYLKHMKPIGLKKVSASYGFIAAQNKKMIKSED